MKGEKRKSYFGNRERLESSDPRGPKQLLGSLTVFLEESWTNIPTDDRSMKRMRQGRKTRLIIFFFLEEDK